MEAASQQLYRDSPSSPRSSTPVSPGRHQSAKPLPSLPLDTELSLPYRDEPVPVSAPASIVTSPLSLQHRTPAERASTRRQQVEIQIFYTPYTDTPRTPNDDDVPLAQLYPYPAEAPPPYQIAVRDSYSETLAQHIPDYVTHTVQDEEIAVERLHVDDGRLTVEKVVVTIIVAMLLLVIASILTLIAISGFNWKI